MAELYSKAFSNLAARDSKDFFFRSFWSRRQSF
jgi:hypothetical protein